MTRQERLWGFQHPCHPQSPCRSPPGESPAGDGVRTDPGRAVVFLHQRRPISEVLGGGGGLAGTTQRKNHSCFCWCGWKRACVHSTSNHPREQRALWFPGLSAPPPRTPLWATEEPPQEFIRGTPRRRAGPAFFPAVHAEPSSCLHHPELLAAAQRQAFPARMRSHHASRKMSYMEHGVGGLIVK